MNKNIKKNFCLQNIAEYRHIKRDNIIFLAVKWKNNREIVYLIN
jgi:hypothetical protein